MTCDVCNRELAVGAWPFCPHEPAKGLKYFEDAIPGGMVFENGFDTPQTFYSHSEHRAALAARGLQIGAKWAGPNDKHLTNWAAGTVDLDGAAALVSRGEQARAEKRRLAEAYEPIPITVTTVTYARSES